nr:integrase, catalytic region, zinc finger, CCHC-type, peptidase aspartic, catalytic [Tanacetum cinerariifolium]
LKNNRNAHEVYIEKTRENTDTIRGFSKHARTHNPSEPLLASAYMFTKHLQELLVYVSQTCPNSPKPSKKLVAVTLMNKDKRVGFAEPVTSSRNIFKHTDSLKTKYSNKPLFTYIGVKPITSASGSRPLGNTKNNRITRPPSSNQKNKVEDHFRKVKSCSNKMNYVSEPEKVLVITALKEQLDKLKGKAVITKAVSLNPIDPKLLKLDVTPVVLKLRKNRTAHIEYIRHTQGEAATLRKIVESERLLSPLNTSLDYAYNTKNNRIRQTPKKAKKNKVEDHLRMVNSSLNKASIVDSKATSSVLNSMSNVNSNLKCALSNGCLFSDNNDTCVGAYKNSVNARKKSKSVKPPVKRKVWKPTGNVFKTVRYIWKPTGQTFTLVGNVCPLTRIATPTIVPPREPILIFNKIDKPVVTLYLDSGCSKHMTEDRSQLINFIQKFLGMVKFGNDHVAKIMVYGDYHIGNVTISRVYYVEGLGHNLFSVGQFCDSDLEVAFRQHTCFIRNLEGVDLQTVKRKVWKTTGKVFKSVGHIWKPTGRIFTLVGNVCPLTRIATPTIGPLRKPIPIVNSTDKPVVTLVYSRKPKTKKVSNKMEPNNSWGSSSSNVPSSLFACRNDHVAKIMGYGDYQIGNVTISRVYYMERLGHRQFYDSDLEVAFRQHTCFIRNLDGVDLLTGSRGNNLYTLSIQNMMASFPICLLSKASKTKSWLWHRRLSHLNFGPINHLARQGLVRGLSKLKFVKDHLCSACAMGKSTRKTHKPKSEDTNQEKLYLLYMDLYGPMQAVATACFTQNRSIICLRHGKTSYELLHSKLQPKADIRIFIGYASTKKAFRIYNRRTRRIVKTIHVDFDELTTMAFEPHSSGPALNEMTPGTISLGLVPSTSPLTYYVPPSQNDWDLLFQPMFDKLLNPLPSVVNQTPEAIAPITEVIPPCYIDSTGSPSSTTVEQDAPFTTHMGNDLLIGVPIPEVNSAQSTTPASPQAIMQSNHPMPHHNSKWTKDHPLNNIIGQLSRPVSTRLQLHEQALFCFYDAFLTSMEPKTYKEALTQFCWIEAMQE